MKVDNRDKYVPSCCTQSGHPPTYWNLVDPVVITRRPEGMGRQASRRIIKRRWITRFHRGRHLGGGKGRSVERGPAVYLAELA